MRDSRYTLHSSVYIMPLCVFNPSRHPSHLCQFLGREEGGAPPRASGACGWLCCGVLLFHFSASCFHTASSTCCSSVCCGSVSMPSKPMRQLWGSLSCLWAEGSLGWSVQAHKAGSIVYCVVGRVVAELCCLLACTPLQQWRVRVHTGKRMFAEKRHFAVACVSLHIAAFELNCQVSIGASSAVLS